MNDETIEMWEARKEESKSRRAKHRQNSTAILKAKGIPFESKNGGAHLIVDGRIDYWPGTGKYTVRKTQHSGRGIFNLLKTI